MFVQIGLFFRKHFIPHIDNDHRPHALRHGHLFAYGVGMITIKAIAISLAIIIPSASVFSGAITATNVITLTNQARKNNGLETLEKNSSLTSAAQAKADDMVSKSYFAHTSPEGLTPWYWIGKTGYKYRVAGENLAVHFTTAESINESWLASTLHRANILNKQFQEIGIGISRGVFEGYDTTFVVQMFGLSAESKTLASTEQKSDQNLLPDVFTLKSITEKRLLEKEKQTGDLFINSSNIRVTPDKGKYHVVAEVQNATSVKTVLGAATTNMTLAFADDDIWQGWIPFNTTELDPTGTHLFLVAADNNQEIIKSVALVAPATNSETVFSLDKKTEYKLFGLIPLQDLNYAIDRFFIIAIFVLGGLLLLNTLVKIHHQKHSTLAHMLVLIILAGVLAIL